MLYKKYAHIASKIIPSEQSSSKSIIFDMEGVLFSISRLKQTSIILFIIMKHPSLIFFILTKNIRAELFTILKQVPAQTKTQKMFNQNKEIPLILIDWMTGYDHKNLLTATVACITTSNYSTGEKALFCSIAEWLFTPEKFIESVRPIKIMHKLAYALKSKGYKLYILSNWDAESFSILIKKHQSFFKIFDDILISGNEKIGKPDPEFYQILLQRHQLNPAECVFIDDEQHNIMTAQKLGIQGILQKSFTSVVHQLRKIGIMKQKN